METPVPQAGTMQTASKRQRSLPHVILSECRRLLRKRQCESKDLVFCLQRHVRLFMLGVAFCGFACTSSTGQEKKYIDLTGVKEETRFGPGTLCGSEPSEGTISSERRLRLALRIPGKQVYKVGEELTFELTIENIGQEMIIFPMDACSKHLPIANHTGVTEACINLEFVNAQGESDWFTGPCLCGGPGEAADSLRRLKAGDSIALRAKTQMLLTDPELFGDVYNGSKPTLVLTPGLSFYRQYFPVAQGSRPIDGCVKRIPVQIEAESNASVQIVAAAPK